jgi:hypothetical protein
MAICRIGCSISISRRRFAADAVAAPTTTDPFGV